MVSVVWKNNKQILQWTKQDLENNFSFLSVVKNVDNLPTYYLELKQFNQNFFILKSHDNIPLGYIPDFALNEVKNVASDILEDLFILQDHSLLFKPDLEFTQRNKLLDSLALRLLKESTNLTEIKKWRNEKYSIWIKHNTKEPYILIERSMAGLFGIITYGIHINGYLFDKDTNELKMWIPRRSATKPTWPSMLDNVVAGGLSYPYSIYETALKESSEEANLSPQFINDNIKSTGVLSYFHYPKDIKTDTFVDESSFLVGEVEYIFDIQFPNDNSIVPKPNDDEVENFNLLTLQDVIDNLQKLNFKPNCGLVTLDFLIRHGYITPENEPNYFQIVNAMHRTLPFPTRN